MFFKTKMFYIKKTWQIESFTLAFLSVESFCLYAILDKKELNIDNMSAIFMEIEEFS